VARLSEIFASFAGRGSSPTASLIEPSGEAPPRPGTSISEVIPDVPSSPVSGAFSSEPILTHEFQKAFHLIESGTPFVFITGRAGTGKSTFIQLLKQRLKSYAIVAPTGVAALNVGGQTIHSFFRIAPGPVDFDKIQRVRNRIAYQALQTLIIDEISMVRADLLDAVEKTLRLNGRDADKPFGGVQIVAVGDLFQLPPVVTAEEEQVFLHRTYKSPFFFSSTCLKETPIRCVEFLQIFRQQDAEFIGLLNSIREGKGISQALTGINQRVRPVDPEMKGALILTGDNTQAAQLNSHKLRQLDSKSVTYAGNITGEFRVDKQKLPAPFELTLKKGSQVMFVKNDGSRRWVNGTIGTVTELEDCSVTVDITDVLGSREVRVQTESWENRRFVYDPEENRLRSETVGTYSQIPLTLAWAVTIHKSQGKTFDKVHIDLSRGAFAAGQVYVALSRCRSLEGISLEKQIEAKDIHFDFDVIQFYKQMNENAVSSELQGRAATPFHGETKL
jgi:hypothetical protein